MFDGIPEDHGSPPPGNEMGLPRPQHVAEILVFMLAAWGLSLCFCIIHLLSLNFTGAIIDILMIPGWLILIRIYVHFRLNHGYDKNGWRY